jgi:hypothetical protein
LGQCRTLADRLLQNGKNGIGSAQEAGAGAEVAIHTFLDFYEKLTVDEAVLPPLLMKEIAFLRRCVRRCHPDEPVITYAETCTDTTYQRILQSITGHEATLASMGLDAKSEDYRKIVAETKHQLADRIRQFTPHATTEPQGTSYDRLPVQSSTLVNIALAFKKILLFPDHPAPDSIQSHVEKLLLPTGSLESFILLLLQFNAKELREFSENPHVSASLDRLMGRTIQTADNWLQLLTYISPEKITILHTPRAVENILQNLQANPHISVPQLVSNLLNALVMVKKEVVLAAVKPFFQSLTTDSPQEPHVAFSQKEIEALNKLLSLIRAPVSDEYPLLRTKIKAFCDTPDYARNAKFNLKETALMKSAFNAYEFLVLLNELKPYLITLNARQLADICSIFIRFDMLSLVRNFFDQSVLKQVLLNTEAYHPVNLRRNFYQFLSTVKALCDDALIEKFVTILEVTSPTWMRYVLTTDEARDIIKIFPRQHAILSELFKSKFESCASCNSAQIKRILKELSDIERAAYFDRHREQIIKIIKSVPDFINIYTCVVNDPSRCQPLFREFIEKFSEFTETFRHVKLMGEELTLEHFGEYLNLLAPHFIDMITRANASGQEKKPFFRNILLILKELEADQQMLLIEFIFKQPDIIDHLKQNIQETKAGMQTIKMISGPEVKSFIQAGMLSLSAAIPTQLSFFGQSAASAGAEASSEVRQNQPPRS